MDVYSKLVHNDCLNTHTHTHVRSHIYNMRTHAHVLTHTHTSCMYAHTWIYNSLTEPYFPWTHMDSQSKPCHYFITFCAISCSSRLPWTMPCAQLAECQTRDSIPRREHNNFFSVFPSQKCCADSLSVCPTLECIRKHDWDDHVLVLSCSPCEFCGKDPACTLLTEG